MSMSKKRIGMAIATGCAGLATALAVALPASASTIIVKNYNLAPGQEYCEAALATSSIAAVGVAQLPGVKFKLIYQDGTVVNSTPGPATHWAPYYYPGTSGWLGPGDYTACAKNNGTTTVLLNQLSVDGE